jgi:PhnB protein
LRKELEMAKSPPPGFPRVTPYLLYEDVPTALAWLTKAFGFKERLRFADDDGTVNHAEMEYEDGVIMLGDPGDHYRSPKRSESVTVQLHVYVDDVDGHLKRAQQEGAQIVRDVADQPYGDRSYSAKDPEGHLWTFSQHIRDVKPSEWGAAET